MPDKFIPDRDGDLCDKAQRFASAIEKNPGSFHLSPADADRLKKMGINDLKKVYRTEDLATGSNVIFAAAGVTDGSLLKGVRFFGEGIRTHCLVMTAVPHQVRFIDTIHAKDEPDLKIRF